MHDGLPCATSFGRSGHQTKLLLRHLEFRRCFVTYRSPRSPCMKIMHSSFLVFGLSDVLHTTIVILHCVFQPGRRRTLQLVHHFFFSFHFLSQSIGLSRKLSYLRCSLIPWGDKFSYSYERKAFPSSAILDFVSTGSLPCAAARSKTSLQETVHASAS